MIYSIKNLSVDCSSRLITRDGAPVSIPMRAFDCLCVLIQNSDRAVSRDELIQNVWGHQGISDNQLSQLIVSLRRLVGDNGMRQRMIRTVPGYGYHWIGSVVEEDEDRSMQDDPIDFPESNPSDVDVEHAGGCQDLPVLDEEGWIEEGHPAQAPRRRT